MTEETNMSSEKQESTQETSGSAEEKKTPAESEQMVPVAKHAALRTRAQNAELEAANLRGQLTALQQTTTAPSVKSPMEIAMEAEGVADPDDLEKPITVLRAQQKWEKDQAEQAAQAEATQVRSQAQLASRESAMLVHDDWQQVVSAAVKYMTQGEMLDLNLEGENFGEAIYAKSQEVLERVKPVKTAPDETSESEAAKLVAKKAEEDAAEATKKQMPTQEEILDGLKNVDPVTAAASQL